MNNSGKRLIEMAKTLGMALANTANKNASENNYVDTDGEGGGPEYILIPTGYMTRLRRCVVRINKGFKWQRSDRISRLDNAL
jgi:hypothetical protein